MAVLDLQLLQVAVVVVDRVSVLVLPLLGDLLLLDDHAVRALLVALVSLLGLQELSFQVSNLDVALVVELVDAVVEDNLHAVQLRDRALLLVSQLIDELSEALVVIEVAFIVAHVGVQLDLLLVLQDSCLLSLVLDRVELIFQLFVLALAATDLLFAHGLLLVDLLAVRLILHARVLLEGAPLVLQLGHFFAETVAIHSESLCVLIGVRELAAEVRKLICLLI